MEKLNEKKWSVKEKQIDEKFIYKSLVSPTSGKRYTIEDALLKFFFRRNFESDFTILKFDPQYPWGTDYDGILTLTAESLESKWTESIVSKLFAQIPFHVTGAGKVEFGYFGSCDPDEDLPEYYNSVLSVHVGSLITFQEGDGEPEGIEFLWEEAPREIQDDIIKIAEQAIINHTIEFIAQS
ncbi:MAG TPA: hypothetical protein VFD28_00635 [Candidatus Eisenbacteria bacterium]|nr:hypothetical protein [Candidatus Eisenbacteria bacterium]